jgi:transcriptional regulator with XRE-family HTH domain
LKILSTDQQAAFVSAGQKLRKLREQKGLSQEDLAFEAKVDQSTLSKVERLGPQNISLAKLIAIADKLNCIVEIDFRSND